MIRSEFFTSLIDRMLSFAEKHAVWILLLILLSGTLIRMVGIPHSVGSHPDERHMVSVVERMSFSDLNPKSFAYGSFSYYMTFFTSEGLGQIWPSLRSYDGIFYVGRSLCVLWGMLTVVFTYLLGRELSKSNLVGLIAATLLSFNFFHTQLSRFFTSDIPLTFFCTYALYYMVKFVGSPHNGFVVRAGIGTGLALACKVAAVYLAAPFVTALIVSGISRRIAWKSLAFSLGIFSVLTACSFTLTSPYALLDFTTFRDQVFEQLRMVKGEWRPPYIIQFENTAPFLYPLQEIGNYTVSWLVLGLSLAGMIATLKRKDLLGNGYAVLLVWVSVFFGLTAGMPVKFPRYLLPIYPGMLIFTALALVVLLGKKAKTQASTEEKENSESLQVSTPSGLRSLLFEVQLTDSVPPPAGKSC